MHFKVISIFPEMFPLLWDKGVCARAVKDGRVEISYISPRDYSDNSYHKIDDKPFGGGSSMVMMYNPLEKAITDVKKSLKKPPKVIYLSPQGKLLTQKIVRRLSKEKVLVLLCGRYKGIDERLIDRHVDEEISIGDYILSGGEIPAMVLMDSLVRLIPGVLNDKNSIVEDSFHDGLLDCPHYTRPRVLDNKDSVPDVLLSGDHKKINAWRYKQKLVRTYLRRKDMFNALHLSDKDKEIFENLEGKFNSEGK
jgi:tRNA (guanine37-N1)-methyltransferase